MKYWTRQPYLGFGVDAHSMLPTDLQKNESRRAVRFATPDSLDAYMNRAPHTVTTVSAQAAIEESFFLGLRLNRGIDLDSLLTTFMNCHPERSEEPAVCRESAGTAVSSSPPRHTLTADAVAVLESAIQQCVREGLLEQQGSILRLTDRGRLLSNEVFARFLIEETKVGTGHVNPR